MKRGFIIAWLVALGLVGIAVGNAFFVVDQRQTAVVLRLGQPIAVINAPGTNEAGLKLKAPLIDQVARFDRRSQALDAGETDVVSADQSRFVVDGVLRYRIDDPLAFYRAVGDGDGAGGDRLSEIANAALRQVLGAASASDILSGQRAALAAKAQAIAAAQARAAVLGVTVLDLHIQRVDLPDPERTAVFARMQSAQNAEAAQIRAAADAQKREIEAATDRDAAVTLAAAQNQAQAVRADADAQRAQIFAKSYGRDPAFAAFYRSMQAYQATLGQGQTTLVLTPDSPLFKYLQGGAGR